VSEVREVDDGGFREWMSPRVEAIREFATAVRDLGDLAGRAATAGSRAMEEIAEGAGYARRTFWDDPVHDAHTFGGLTLLATSDYVHGFGDLFAGPQVPLYSYLAMARPTLESAVVAAWLNEPGVSTLERIKRALCEQIYSADEVVKLNLTTDAAQNLSDWQSVAASFGWTGNFSRSLPIIDGTKRPRINDGIRALMGREDQSRIGDLLFSRLSAVTHVTWFGLQWALDIDTAKLNPATGLGSVSVGTDSSRVSGIASYVVRALREAAQARVTLMGWADGGWLEARNAATRLELELLTHAVSPDAPDDAQPR
jgi:hypothetical protein